MPSEQEQYWQRQVDTLVAELSRVTRAYNKIDNAYNGVQDAANELDTAGLRGMVVVQSSMGTAEQYLQKALLGLQSSFTVAQKRVNEAKAELAKVRGQ